MYINREEMSHFIDIFNCVEPSSTLNIDVSTSSAARDTENKK